MNTQPTRKSNMKTKYKLTWKLCTEPRHGWAFLIDGKPTDLHVRRTKDSLGTHPIVFKGKEQPGDTDVHTTMQTVECIYHMGRA